MTNVKNQFVKPTINFPLLPTINIYIHAKYEKVNTPRAFVDFVNHCFDEAETSKNEIRKQAYSNVASALYGIATGQSYESKAINLLVEKL